MYNFNFNGFELPWPSRFPKYVSLYLPNSNVIILLLPCCVCCASTMFDPTYICLEAVRHASVFVMFVKVLAACIWQYISFSLQESSVSGTMMLTFTLFACPLLVNLENHYLAKRVEYVHWNEFWSTLLKNTIWIARVGEQKFKMTISA